MLKNSITLKRLFNILLAIIWFFNKFLISLINNPLFSGLITLLAYLIMYLKAKSTLVCNWGIFNPVKPYIKKVFYNIDYIIKYFFNSINGLS